MHKASPLLENNEVNQEQNHSTGGFNPHQRN
jgi:hypothetical protein